MYPLEEIHSGLPSASRKHIFQAVIKGNVTARITSGDSLNYSECISALNLHLPIPDLSPGSVSHSTTRAKVQIYIFAT